LAGPTLKTALAPLILDALLAAISVEPHLDLDGCLRDLRARMADPALQI